ncbi:hypothetical protein [Pedobacter sp. SYP-B3415]|uniref:hypothetical protein n=1 Tax=Pedobacter sp. SYP-B3415 TaxID=2496641 RepID=UPI00101DC55B|nr:hypothetical protein [Pedobacter sp. SYP-B3415]
MIFRHKRPALLFCICVLTCLACHRQAGKHDDGAAAKPDTPAEVPLQPEIASAIEQDEFTFLALDQNGDDDLLFLIRGRDTLDMICNQVDLPQLYRGDKISVQWNDKRFVPAGDPEAVSVKPFVASLRVVSAGRLSRLMKEKPLKLGFDGGDSTLSDTGIEQMREALLYYLANIKDPLVRKVVDDARVRPLSFSARKTEANEQDTYEIGLSAPEYPEPYFKVVFYRFENRFDIWDHNPFQQ